MYTQQGPQNDLNIARNISVMNREIQHEGNVGNAFARQDVDKKSGNPLHEGLPL